MTTKFNLVSKIPPYLVEKVKASSSNNNLNNPQSDDQIATFTVEVDAEKIGLQITTAILDHHKLKPLKNDISTSGYLLFHPRSGCFLPETKPVSILPGVKDGDIVEVHTAKDVDNLTIVLLPSATPLTAANVTKYGKVVKADFTDTLRRIIPNIVRLFSLKPKEEYYIKKLTVKDQTVKVGDITNPNLNCTEQSIKKGSFLLLESLDAFMEKTLDQIVAGVDKDRLHSGLMTKTSKKGDAKETGAKKRWCLLLDNFLFYFTNNKGITKPSGVVDLNFMTVSRENQTTIKLEGSDVSFRQQPITYMFIGEEELDTNKWFAKIRNECMNGDLRRVFGLSLKKSFLRKNNVLSVLVKTINYMDARGLDTPGIFKEVASNAPVEKFKLEFDQGKDVDLSDCMDPCVVAALLKVYLKELPQPLLTFKLYSKFLAAKSDLKLLQELISQLPPANQLVLEVLLHFMGRVLSHKPKNGIDHTQLIGVLGSIFLRPKEEKSDAILADIANIELIVRTLLENRYTLTFAKPAKRGWTFKLKNSNTAKALYDYNAQGKANARGEMDLNMKKGEVFTILDERVSGWIKIRLNDREGLVPLTYVAKEDDGELEIGPGSKKKKEPKTLRKTKDSGSGPSTPNLPRQLSDNVDYKAKYEAEKLLRMKLEEELSDLKAKLAIFEMRANETFPKTPVPPPKPKSFIMNESVDLDPIPPPPSDEN